MPQVRTLPFSRLVPLVWLALPLPVSMAGASSELTAKAWRDATRYLFREAGETFSEAPTDRETRLGRAALLLLRQPKTVANLDQAVGELESLAEAPAPDEIAPLARYLLGRIAQVHRAVPDPAVAAEHYRRLIAGHPLHPLADQARVKLALIELYAPGLGAEERAERHDRLAAEAGKFAGRAGRRDLHLVLAAAAHHHRLGDERILRHYLAAEEAGVLRPAQRANVRVAIGETASRLGREDLAREQFGRFVAEFPRDNRRRWVLDRLAALSAEEARPAASPESR